MAAAAEAAFAAAALARDDDPDAWTFCKAAPGVGDNDTHARDLRETFRRRHQAWADRAGDLAELEDEVFRFPEDRH